MSKFSLFSCGVLLGVAGTLGVSQILEDDQQRVGRAILDRTAPVNQRGETSARVSAETGGVANMHAGPQASDGDRERDVGQLREAATLAISQHDWKIYVQVLKDLAARNAPEARVELSRLMADLDTPYPEPMGIFFAEWLKGLRDPSLAIAARKRFEEQIANGGEDWTVGGWLQLVEANGGDEEIDWLLRLAQRSKSSQVREEALLTIARSSRATLRARIAEWIGQGEVPDEVIAEHARQNPDIARPVLENALLASLDRGLDNGPLLVASAYGKSVPIAEFDQALGWLAARTEPRLRLAAASVVSRFIERGLEPTRARVVLDNAQSALERVSQDVDATTDTRAITEALGAVEAAPWMWTPRTLLALESLSSRISASYPSMANDVNGLITRIRTSAHWRSGSG